MASLALAFGAGLLSVLSPCIIPLLPVVFGSAATAHKAGPLVLAGGVGVSFTLIGLVVAGAGISVGSGGAVLQAAAAVLVTASGIVLLAPPLQARLAVAGAPIGDWAQNRFGGAIGGGLGGQFGLGLLLGVVWSPCAGPTLGAASLLAASGHDLAKAGATMLAFGLGAVIPLIALGSLSRMSYARWRGQFAASGTFGKAALGGVLVAIGLLLLTGANHALETWLTERMPDWLLNITTLV
ncbi:MAG: sulfite exporter TauE/SafE family protein [Alphaproteobacteria bacterium]|nr:sulfite exporter TauE/SafE family protein [Alphaproteobacteria bacterium]MBL6938297.1 sulfite exporter TauE/SafE family protein [Alphaproteobacteria bacterium]MBL7097353.1 sulfite exporter TauE/SafE family protein [Alphaproteobacteria bacterium]